jgi:TolB-like protein/class 3 adenylate cyclase/TPR repeat protein
MTETRKLAAILVADVVGYSRLAGADEVRTLARLRGLRSDLIDPAIAAHHGYMVKRTGDGFFTEFRSVVDAVRCAVEVQAGMVERNAGVPPERRIEFRIGIHLGDVVEETDGDLMGDGVNVAARLEGICEPGGISLSGAAHEQVRDRVKETFIDLGEKKLKNIARPVRVFALQSSTGSVAPEGKAPAPKHRELPRLSIVVLPFANIGGDPEQDYFVDGVTDSLTTDLSRIRSAFVIARSTAFTFKGKPINVRAIGRELRVRYALEGSVQRRGDRMRVNVQLLDAESRSHLWADRFDKPLADLFDMQDEIVSRLANTLDAQLISAEARRAEQAANPDSVDLYFQGLAWFNRAINPDNVAQSRGFFDRALAADPDNVDALIGSAATDVVEGTLLFVTDPMAAFVAAEAKLAKALSSVPDHARGHMFLGSVYTFTKRAEEGIAECEHALALDRNLATAHALIGQGKIYIGRAEETEAYIAEALRLSPRDTLAYIWMNMAALAKLHLGSYEQAVAWFRRSKEANRNYSSAYFNMAAALAHLGRLDEGRSAVQAGLALNPAYTVSRVRAAWMARSADPTFLAEIEPIFEGMRKAGLPEQ